MSRFDRSDTFARQGSATQHVKYRDLIGVNCDNDCDVCSSGLEHRGVIVKRVVAKL